MEICKSAAALQLTTLRFRCFCRVRSPFFRSFLPGPACSLTPQLINLQHTTLDDDDDDDDDDYEEVEVGGSPAGDVRDRNAAWREDMEMLEAVLD